MKSLSAKVLKSFRSVDVTGKTAKQNQIANSEMIEHIYFTLAKKKIKFIYPQYSTTSLIRNPSPIHFTVIWYSINLINSCIYLFSITAFLIHWAIHWDKFSEFISRASIHKHLPTEQQKILLLRLSHIVQ